MRRWHWIGVGLAGLAVLLYFVWPRSYCRAAKADYNIEVPECPDPQGKLRQTLRIDGFKLRRGGRGTVRIYAKARYTVELADEAHEAWVDTREAGDFAIKLSILDGDGKERMLTPDLGALAPRERWKRHRHFAVGAVTLPKDLRDGDYKLRARVKTKIDESTVDLPLGLYAPAKIHVLSDRPLYEPGNRIKFRALALRARDLTPIDRRPGTWIVKDPTGTVLLEERAPAGEWGVAAGSFLLDKQAPVGQWTISWRSGKDSASASVKVEPFTLPRFRISATAGKPFYGRGERPKLSGTVIYSSGAPVQKAKVELKWNVQGSWPPPASWRGPAGLPRSATTDDAGAFSVTLPEVPKDLQGKVTLAARLAAVDPAGDRVAGAASVLLSEEPISVAAVTPLGGGLIGGSNNRLYLRVTTADGRPMAGAKIRVRKAWLPGDEGVEAELDADSVARVQVDPGAPVTVVIPAVPYRPQIAAAANAKVSRTRAEDLARGEDATLDDQVELDRWLPLLEPCAKYADDDGEAEAALALRVNESGAITAGAASDEIGRCALERIRRRRLPRGRARYYALTFSFKDPELPSLGAEVSAALGEVPSGFVDQVEAANKAARDCLPKKADVEGELAWVLAWRFNKGQTKPTLGWIRGKRGPMDKMPAGADRCILSRLSGRALETPAADDAEGVVVYAMSQPGEAADERPQPTTMRGYELLVAASTAGKAAGQAKLRLPPGRIPPLTLRARPVLAQAGARIDLELLRGPGFSGSLPRRIMVEHPPGDNTWIKLDKKKGQRKASYTLPKGKHGWFSFHAGGKRALVFVRSPHSLSVAVTPDKPRYAPGATAALALQTRAGKRPVKAGVGLVGVDDSLSQLVPLPGADALGGLRPEVKMAAGKVFGVLDGQALTLGRIRGAYAAEATVLKVSAVPTPAELDAQVDGSAETPFDAVGELTDRFYIVLGQLHRVTREWEGSAPKGEQMRPKKMSELWQKALEAAKAKGQRNDDAYGRRLRLHRLPPDLLALTDPRQVVVVGTRLPEDVENWTDWVRRKRP